MGWRKIGLGNLGGILVSLKGLVGRLLSLVTNGKLSKITVVIALPVDMLETAHEGIWRANAHLVVEDLGLSALG